MDPTSCAIMGETCINMINASGNPFTGPYMETPSVDYPCQHPLLQDIVSQEQGTYLHPSLKNKWNRYIATGRSQAAACNLLGRKGPNTRRNYRARTIFLPGVISQILIPILQLLVWEYHICNIYETLARSLILSRPECQPSAQRFHREVPSFLDLAQT